MAVVLKLSSKMMMSRGKSGEPVVEGDIEAGGIEALLEVGGFEALFEVDVEARRIGESLKVDVEAGEIEAVTVFLG